jgi:hypothetical protein
MLKLPIATLALVLTIFALSAAPASAHQTVVEQGEDFAVTDSDHTSGTVCDWERDGHFISAAWYDDEGLQVGYAEAHGVGECSDDGFHDYAKTVQLCEQEWGIIECTREHKV